VLISFIVITASSWFGYFSFKKYKQYAKENAIINLINNKQKAPIYDLKIEHLEDKTVAVKGFVLKQEDKKSIERLLSQHHAISRIEAIAPSNEEVRAEKLISDIGLIY
ncbi:MAG: hypothetical protein JXQ76_07090, partial [Campylobacterales bacterium]|nr:hypothetical protein [Campylobacterales bacterium]